jgi:N-methylhydantoinase B
MTTLTAQSGVTTTQREVDPVTYEVIRNRLTAVVAQQSLVLKNVSGSALVTEANDCNTGVYLPDGQIVAMGPHNLFHSGSMELVVRHIIEASKDSGGVQDGDVYITNDPYSGALHMPDVTMLQPVFSNGEHVAWVGSCAHVLDIGGMTPSSWSPRATEIFQEGLRLPPTRLISEGKVREDVWNLIMAASRLPANLGLDLKAMLAANHHARDGMLRLIDRYSTETVTTVMAMILDRSEQRIRERLRTLPDGRARARTYFEHTGRIAGTSRVVVELRKSGDQLVFDYAGTSDQVDGFFNCTESGLRGGVFSAILPVLCHDIPWNSGVMRAITVVAPHGTVVNAAYPAPCGAATIGASEMVQSTAGLAVSRLVSSDPALRDEAMAVTTGSITVCHVAGLNQYGEPFGGALTEILSGGGGATAGRNGIDYRGPNEILTCQINNVEGEESTFPVLYLYRSANTDGGGAGRHHGGVSPSSALTLHDAPWMHAVVVGHGVATPTSQGIHGGMPGSTNHVSIVRGADRDRPAFRSGGTAVLEEYGGAVERYDASLGEVMLGGNDVLVWSFHGGGGWGDPLDADASMITSELLSGRVSAESARRLYGVVTKDSGLDGDATTALRARLREERRGWPSTPDPDAITRVEVVEGARRLGDRLVLVEVDGRRYTACDCGHVLGSAERNWKDFSARSQLSAEDLGPKVGLHSELVAEGFACPGCGALLATDVRWNQDDVLHDLELDLAIPDVKGA